MPNALQYVKVHRLERVSKTEVTFIISLNEHPHLRNPKVVDEAMAAYASSPTTMERWYANRVGDWLYISVVGAINPNAH